MKKMFIALLLVPMLEAKEYTFLCVPTSSPKDLASVVIDTKEKFIILGQTKFKDEFENTESSVSASNQYTTTVRNSIYFNKISGKMQQSFTGEKGTFERFDYTCKPAERLMP